MRTSSALASQVRQIKDYLRAVSESQAASMVGSTWDQAGKLADPASKSRYRTEASFAIRVGDLLDDFDQHLVLGIAPAMSRLNHHERRLLRLLWSEQHGRDEVATAMHVSLRTIYRWEREALAKLATLLWDDKGEPIWHPVAPTATPSAGNSTRSGRPA